MKVMDRHKRGTNPAATFSCFLGRREGREGQQTPISQTKSHPATVQVLAETELSTSCWADGNIAASLSTGAGTRKLFASL